MTTITTLVPAAVRSPRAAPLAANLFGLLLRFFQGASQAHTARVEEAGRMKEAEAVRRYAHQFYKHDPRFAADLTAAADRHERGG